MKPDEIQRAFADAGAAIARAGASRMDVETAGKMLAGSLVLDTSKWDRSKRVRTPAPLELELEPGEAVQIPWDKHQGRTIRVHCAEAPDSPELKISHTLDVPAMEPGGRPVPTVIHDRTERADGRTVTTIEVRDKDGLQFRHRCVEPLKPGHRSPKAKPPTPLSDRIKATKRGKDKPLPMSAVSVDKVKKIKGPRGWKLQSTEVNWDTGDLVLAVYRRGREYREYYVSEIDGKWYAVDGLRRRVWTEPKRPKRGVIAKAIAWGLTIAASGAVGWLLKFVVEG